MSSCGRSACPELTWDFSVLQARLPVGEDPDRAGERALVAVHEFAFGPVGCSPIAKQPGLGQSMLIDIVGRAFAFVRDLCKPLMRTGAFRHLACAELAHACELRHARNYRW